MPTKGTTTGQLPYKIVNLNLFAETLERLGAYPVESDLKALLYVTHGDDIALITHTKGCIRLSIKDIPHLCSELMGIYEDDKDRERMGVKN